MPFVNIRDQRSHRLSSGERVAGIRRAADNPHGVCGTFSTFQIFFYRAFSCAVFCCPNVTPTFKIGGLVWISVVGGGAKWYMMVEWWEIVVYSLKMRDIGKSVESYAHR